jgi:hypothetical protein
MGAAKMPWRLLAGSLFLLLGLTVGCGGKGSGSSGALTVTINPGGAVVSLGGTQAFTATVANDPKNAGVTWTLTQNGVACLPACGTLSLSATASGAATKYTAPGAATTVTLTATSVTNTLVAEAVTISVTGSTAVSVVPTAATVALNNGTTGAVYTQQFEATVSNDTANKGVTWTLSQNGQSCSPACGTVSPTSTTNGQVTTYTAPATAPSSPTVTLTANSVAFPGQSDWATITISGGLIVSVSPTYVANVPVNGTQDFTATVTNDPSNKGVTWTLTQNGKACSPGCGTLSPTATASGVATTYTAPDKGVTVTVTATSVAQTTISSYAEAIVQPITISVDPTSVNLYETQTAAFVANVTNDIKNGGVTWALTENGKSCSASACGSLSTTTSASGTQITYTAPGTISSPAAVTLTATSVTETSQTAAAAINLYPPIGITISPSSATVAIGTRTTFTATVTNDPTLAGVQWTLSQNGKSCASSVCGYVSPLSTNSGQATTYFAPATMPSSSTVTLTATSVADVSTKKTATITLASSSAAAKFAGSYAFQFSGYNAGGAVASAGSFTAGGDGTISGVEDVNQASGVSTAVPITGSYTIGENDQGSFTLKTAHGQLLGTFQFALDANGKQAEFIEEDGSGTQGTGVLMRRSASTFSAASLTGDYAFAVAGPDAQGQREALAGRFDANGAGRISAGVLDANRGGSLTTELPFGGGYSISPSGRGTLTATTSNGTLHWAFYVVSPKQLFLISTDPRSAGAFSSGQAEAQIAATFTNASLTGTSVIRFAGTSGGGKASAVGAGLVTFDGAGGLSYAIDENNGGKVSTLSGKGSYSVGPGGRVTMMLGTGANPLISYLVSRNNALLIGTGPAVASGRLDRQTAGPFSDASLAGNYILRTLAAPTSDSAFQWGIVTSAGLGRLEGSASGIGPKGVRLPAQGFAETYAVMPTGRVALGSGNAVLYFISPSRAVAIDLQPGQTHPTISEIVK